jgi:hypothetical protein
MSATVNTITVTAKLYNTRDTMRSLFGDKYEEKVKPIIPQLHKLAEIWNCSLLQAMVRSCAEIEKDGASGIDLAMVMAAYVEDVEGTFGELVRQL